MGTGWLRYLLSKVTSLKYARNNWNYKFLLRFQSNTCGLLQINVRATKIVHCEMPIARMRTCKASLESSQRILSRPVFKRLATTMKTKDIKTRDTAGLAQTLYEVNRSNDQGPTVKKTNMKFRLLSMEMCNSEVSQCSKTGESGCHDGTV